ncbi:Spy/CpxP family protein refolding chaperone [Candidatus Entotheonella palauensis]|uniref:Spy/CpxP family protein refolding chaperone n=1 Tax=Candidatus Entotheonella palauensis TaxID=93172 RepID=UPI000B7E177F|nr:Spy/CpxP family protein refolding chaperone [Candidatus Entotheonella palauensis]
MKKRVISLTLVLGLLMGAGVLTYALADDWGRGRRGHGMHGGKMFGHGIMRMLRTLDLSDDQKEKVSSALMTARKTAIVSRAQIRVARMELHEALLQDSIDEAAIGKLKEQIKTLQGDLLDNRISVQQSISSVLTPEQRSKARTMFLERMSDKSEGSFHHGRSYYGRGHGRYHGDGEGRPRGPNPRN